MTDTVRRTPPAGEMTQRQLALELRYAIDVAQKTNAEPSFARVKELIRGNPVGVKSRHVAHNLGATRIAWLEKRPRLGWRS